MADEIDDSEEPTEEEIAAWPNCAVPDCENKCCTWSGTAFCFPCAERVLGRAELIRRYDATHERTWAQVQAERELEEATGIEAPPNYLNENDG